jgi:hypothetical protein
MSSYRLKAVLDSADKAETDPKCTVQGKTSLDGQHNKQ